MEKTDLDFDEITSIDLYFTKTNHPIKISSTSEGNQKHNHNKKKLT